MCDICDPFGMNYSHHCVCTVKSLKEDYAELLEKNKQLKNELERISETYNENQKACIDIQNKVQGKLKDIINIGHNYDCIFCGLKDKIALGKE